MKMQAILVRKPGAAEALFLCEHPAPACGAHDILVRVQATALNRADILQRKGLYPPPPGASDILGLEFAGTVERAGPACRRWQPGDRVFGLLPGGGYAELVATHEDLALPIPQNLTFGQAAAVPEAFLTAYQALFVIGNLQERQRVLVHAGASGVGTAAIQLARAAGAEVLVTAGAAPKLRVCAELGATTAVNYREGPFAPKVLAATGDAGVHLIVDFVGAPYFEQNIACLAMDGCLVILALLGGGRLEKFDLRQLMRKRLRIEASTLRSRSEPYKIRLTQAFAKMALPLLASGRIAPVVDTVFDWREVAQAHAHMEANKNIGKIVLTGMGNGG